MRSTDESTYARVAATADLFTQYVPGLNRLTQTPCRRRRSALAARREAAQFQKGATISASKRKNHGRSGRNHVTKIPARLKCGIIQRSCSAVPPAYQRLAIGLGAVEACNQCSEISNCCIRLHLACGGISKPRSSSRAEPTSSRIG